MRIVSSLGLAATLTLATTASPHGTAPHAAKAKRAILQPSDYPFVVLGRERLRLAPGALIYDTQNRKILPNSLPAEADVVFTTDQTGHVSRIYLLTAQEIQQLERSRR